MAISLVIGPGVQDDGTTTTEAIDTTGVDVMIVFGPPMPPPGERTEQQQNAARQLGDDRTRHCVRGTL